MLNGLDSIGLTLQHEDAIAAYENKQPAFMRNPFTPYRLQVMHITRPPLYSVGLDKRVRHRFRVTHQTLMPGIFRHFYTIFTARSPPA